MLNVRQRHRNQTTEPRALAALPFPSQTRLSWLAPAAHVEQSECHCARAVGRPRPEGSRPAANISIRPFRFLRGVTMVLSFVLLAIGIWCPEATAQFSIGRIVIPDDIDVEFGGEEEVTDVLASVVTAPAQGANAAANDAELEKTKKERMDAIGKLTFDRRASTILKLWSERAIKAKSDASKPKSDVPTEANSTESVQGEKIEKPAAKVPEVGKEQPRPPKLVDPDGAASKPEDVAAKAKLEAEVKAKEEADAKAKTEAEAKAKAAAAAKEKKQFEELLKGITESVTLGEWDRFREMIALSDRVGDRLSKEESQAIYNRMIEQLGAQAGMDFSQAEGLSKEMQQFMQQMMGDQRNNPGLRYAEKNSLNFADMAAIIRSAPEELKDEQVIKLANLLRMTLNIGNQLQDFVSTLKSEGDKLLPKQKAALLLSSAAQDEFTVDFLPTKQEAIESKNRQALNLLSRHFLALYKKDSKESFREEAWQTTLAALEIPSLPNEAAESTEATSEPAKVLTKEEKEAKEQLGIRVAKRKADEQDRTQALTRAVSLAPQLREELGKTWLEESFTKFPERGQEIMAKIGTATAQLLAQSPQDEANRTRNLELQYKAVTQFFATEPKLDGNWIGILNLLATNWLQEAQVSRDYSRDSQYGPSMRRDGYGNIYYGNSYDEEEDFGNSRSMRMGQITAVKINKILETAPSARWLEAIDKSILPQFNMSLCRLWLKVNEDAKAFPYIEQLATTHPNTARELADEFLKVWTSNHNPNETRQRTNYYMFMYGYEQKADKIPLTRSKQDRNLKELASWVKRLQALPLNSELDEELLVKAFMTCHSVAEVYDIEDIELVFGAWGSIESGTMASLIQKMRANLSGTWREPNVQRDAKTKRKKSDIQAEVVRGYSVAKRVLDKAIEQYPGDWQLLLAKACIMHDENDYLQEVAPSSEFSTRRQAAFGVFAEASQAYLKQAPELPERKQKNDVFENWFYAALGATDLKGISEKNRPADEQITEIATAMNSLTGEIGTRHRDRFANALFTRMSAVSPSCKFRYVEAGFKLVGDNPQAEEARKVYNYYKDLVTELQLVTRVDGDTRIGHEEPFGVYVDLRHTVQLERESGGFTKYLQNQNNAMYSFNYGRPTENYRDKFSDAAKLALQEHFDVLSVTFNHSETKSIAGEPSGWRITPYAYLLLKARGPEVDKLPSLKMDLDFMDTSGHVVLPIASSPIPIDATARKSSSGPSNIKMVQLLDERQSVGGKLIVETKVTARGLVPPREDVLNTSVKGFELADVKDSGVSVIEFDKESAKPIVLSERTWTLKYASADPSGKAPESFAFPEPLLETTDLTYQRYVDADLQEVEASVALVEKYGTNRRAWYVGSLFAVAGIVILLGGAIALRRLSSRSSKTVSAPQPVTTPFSLLSHLQGIAREEELPSEKKTRLREDIAVLEHFYFAESNGRGEPDLVAIASRWR